MEIITRESRELLEHTMFARDAAFSDATEGRMRSGQPDLLRTEYQRDRDKIVHAKSFRRLSHKTQVFISAEGDHFRTRLTHTLEVAQISRTIARALGLNEDLTEAIALGHDLGHTPFGHTGEDALTECLARHVSLGEGTNAAAGEETSASAGDGTNASAVQKTSAPAVFMHNVQSLRVVETIENAGRGLNLTAEVRDGIVHHTGSVRAETYEGRIVALSDRIAYVNHDIDDAMRAGLLTTEELPQGPLQVLGMTHSERIEALVVDAVRNSAEVGDVALTDEFWQAMNELRAFLFDHVYHHPSVEAEVGKARRLVCALFEYFLEHPEEIPVEYRTIAQGDTLRAVTDYVAGMTDRYAVRLYEELFVPHPFGIQ